MQTHTLASPIGPLSITVDQDKLVKLDFIDLNTTDQSHHPYCQQLAAYFQNPTHAFAINLHLSGSLFQKTVWKALQNIPSGQTMTYGELAQQLGTSARAIGQACRTNPVPIIVPCHRVIAANHAGGYAGHTSGKLLAIKKYLLDHERRSTKPCGTGKD